MTSEQQTVARFSAPRSLAEMKQQDGKIRGLWEYNTSIRRGDQGLPLDFAQEATGYNDRVLLQRGEDDLSAIRSVADRLYLDSNTKIICCILCHASEPTTLYNLDGIVDLIAKCGGHTVIYVNASGPGFSLTDCEAAATELETRLCGGSPHSGRVTILTHLFTARPPIGTIRGILTDGVVLAAAKAGLSDPVLLSTDVDFVATASNYGEIILESFADPRLDILSGPVFYGYDHLGIDHTDVGLNAPELFLGNRAFYYKKLAAAKGLILGEPYYPTDGPNTAYRLSAYCAAGGHCYAFQSGEDNYIGAAIFALRNDDFSTIPQTNHACYDPAFWLATDPRRQLQAVALGYPIDETWLELPFYAKLGSSMQTRELVKAYQQSVDLIQLDDLRRPLSRKIGERVAKIFDASIAEGAFPDPAIRYQASAFGLTLGEDGRRSLDLEGHLASLLADFRANAGKPST